MTRTRRSLHNLVHRIVYWYERARSGNKPGKMVRQAAALDDYEAILEVETYELAKKKQACCAKCGAQIEAKQDARAMGMDVVFVPRRA